MDIPTHMFAHLKNRPDSEHEQVLIRVGLAIFALVFLFIAYEFADDTSRRTEVLTIAFLYLVFSMLLTVVMWFDPEPSPSRRFLGIAIDMSIVTYALSVTGSTGAPLYGGYLWAIIANGFRFGKPYLYFAQVLAVIGFTFVISTNSFWSEYPMFGIGLLIWLIVIPPYVSILLGRLSTAVDQAKHADQAKTHFLANMSHELRTPLNAIIGYTELLIEEMQEQGQDEHVHDLNQIHLSSTHLLGLINEVLDLSKVEEGRMDVLYEDVQIQELATDVISTVQPIAEKNQNQLKVDVMPSISTLRTDVTKLRQVLFNLLSNACKFTHNGHIALAVKESTHNDEAYIEFNVIDDGIGVTPEKIEHIFKPFRQENEATSKEYGGTGLGLALSKRFCELVGGKLLVKSRKGEGSTFTVLIPVSPPG